MSTSLAKLVRKTKLVMDCGQCCVWCKKELSFDELTIEHVVRHEDSKKHVLNVACSKCNTLHGAIVERFNEYIKGGYKDQYFLYLRRAQKAQTDMYNAIVNNSWFQLSIAKHKENKNFRHNPSNINLINDTCSTYRTKIEEQDLYFMPVDILCKKVYSWQYKCLQSHS